MTRNKRFQTIQRSSIVYFYPKLKEFSIRFLKMYSMTERFQVRHYSISVDNFLVLKLPWMGSKNYSEWKLLILFLFLRDKSILIKRG